MTHDQADQIVRAHLIDHLNECDMAEVVGFPSDKLMLQEAARLRLAQERVSQQLRLANGEPALFLRKVRA